MPPIDLSTSQTPGACAVRAVLGFTLECPLILLQPSLYSSRWWCFGPWRWHLLAVWVWVMREYSPRFLQRSRDRCQRWAVGIRGSTKRSSGMPMKPPPHGGQSHSRQQTVWEPHTEQTRQPLPLAAAQIYEWLLSTLAELTHPENRCEHESKPKTCTCDHEAPKKLCSLCV